MGIITLFLRPQILCQQDENMNPVVLQNHLLKATFLPEVGMNLSSFQRGGVEVIDQSTRKEFEERYAGLGALIGPHFHRRNPNSIAPIQQEDLFPHIARVRAKGIEDPFSHGIARYAPWKVEHVSEKKISASLSGKDEWNGVPLAVLENQNFKLDFSAELVENEMQIDYSVVSEKDSLVGLHYYYRLPNKRGMITTRVQKECLNKGERKLASELYPVDEQQMLQLPLIDFVDTTFYPFPHHLEGDILLETEEYTLRTKYWCQSQENCWQLYHPKDASFVCVEPLSAQDPRHPNLTVSSIRVHLQILTGNHA